MVGDKRCWSFCQDGRDLLPKRSYCPVKSQTSLKSEKNVIDVSAIVIVPIGGGG